MDGVWCAGVRRVFLAALLGVVVLAIAPTNAPLPFAATTAYAQESQPVDDTLPATEHHDAPAHEDIPWWEHLDQWFGGGNGNETILRLLGWLFSRIVVNGVRWMGETVHSATGRDLGGGESILVQLPRSMTLEAPWVITGHRVFSGVANAAFYGAFLLALLVNATGGLLGFTTAEARSVLAVSVLAWYANRRALELVGALQLLSNAMAANFADPTELLPGWNHLSELQRGSGEGLLLFLTGVFGLLLSFTRWLTLLGFNILVVLLPMALLLAIHPATRGFFSLWWRGLLGLLFVQVPMALAIGQGQALIAQYGAGAAGGTLLAGIACFCLAGRMTKMVGGLAALPGQVSGGIRSNVTQVATFAAAGWAGGQAAAGRAVVNPVPPSTPATFGGGASASPGNGPTWYRSAPLLPAPLATLSAPPRPPAPHTVNSTGRRNTMTEGSCDGRPQAAAVGSSGAAPDAIPWSADGGETGGPAAILGGDPAWVVQRGRRG